MAQRENKNKIKEKEEQENILEKTELKIKLREFKRKEKNKTVIGAKSMKNGSPLLFYLSQALRKQLKSGKKI